MIRTHNWGLNPCWNYVCEIWSQLSTVTCYWSLMRRASMIKFSKLIIYVWINYSSINAEKIAYRHSMCCFINDSFHCDYINVYGSVLYCLRGVIPSYLNLNSHTQYSTCRSCYQFGTLYSIFAIKLKKNNGQLLNKMKPWASYNEQWM